jgi:acyl-CoA oxidase
MTIAEAALFYAMTLHKKTEEYAKTKICNGLAGETTLYSMPQVRTVFDESYLALEEMMAFTAGVEEQLNNCLYNGIIPDPDLVEKIAVCKIRCIQVALTRVNALQQEVGSYALMHNTGFELTNMLLTCKFAEGDSRILQMKLARDRLKKMKKTGVLKAVKAVFSSGSWRNGLEALTALYVAARVAPAGRNPKKMAEAIDANWRAFYSLADQVADRHIANAPKGRFFEPCENRIKGSSTNFDAGWKDKL